ncbi:MAG: peptide deformylase, partial [Clostridia bacterium]|nr:peptide deformylase [Clostridia bacterium]
MEVITIFENEKFLRQKSKDVDIKNDKDLPKDISLLKTYLTEHPGFYALASIQLGIDKKILYVCSPTPDTSKNDEKDHIVMINPQIIEQKGKTEFWEACISCLQFCSLVERPYKMKIKYFTPTGEEKVKEFEGFVCTVLSHEIDHFDGIFHMDRAKKTITISREDTAKLRQKEPYRVISK